MTQHDVDQLLNPTKLQLIPDAAAGQLSDLARLAEEKWRVKCQERVLHSVWFRFMDYSIHGQSQSHSDLDFSRACCSNSWARLCMAIATPCQTTLCTGRGRFCYPRWSLLALAVSSDHSVMFGPCYVNNIIDGQALKTQG